MFRILAIIAVAGSLMAQSADAGPLRRLLACRLGMAGQAAQMAPRRVAAPPTQFYYLPAPVVSYGPPAFNPPPWQPPAFSQPVFRPPVYGSPIYSPAPVTQPSVGSNCINGQCFGPPTVQPDVSPPRLPPIYYDAKPAIRY